MKQVFIHGVGAVSPAGWGLDALRAAVAAGVPAGGADQRAVPPPSPRPACLAHPRLRRSSPVSQFAVAAAVEALGGGPADGERLGVILAVHSGCVQYSRRFHAEALRDPATASPLLFPETVFNAPASHLAAVLGTRAVNCTLVGDAGAFLDGLGLAANWLAAGELDACLVVGAEELDPLTLAAFRLFAPRITLAEGAGALLLRAGDGTDARAELRAVTEAHTFTDRAGRDAAAAAMFRELAALNPPVLVDGRCGTPFVDGPENRHAFAGQRLSPGRVLGHGLCAGAAWQAGLGVELTASSPAPVAMSVVGVNQQAAGAVFSRWTAGNARREAAPCPSASS